jgi:diamine N-acetyltransferase
MVYAFHFHTSTFAHFRTLILPQFHTMKSISPEIEIKLAVEQDLPVVRKLAEAIFPVTYENIVPEGQPAYMMNLIYTDESLLAQQKEGQVFLIIFHEGIPSGFAGFSRLNAHGDFKLNKLYVDGNRHGKGLGKWLLSDVIHRVKSEAARSLLLNVNRFNKAIGFYENMGFSKIKEELVDIGNGYFMDDYVMEMKF